VHSLAISGKTIKEIVGACRWVFSRVEEDAGLYRNPWDNVVLPTPTPIARDVFTAHELQLINDGIQADPFNYVLFFVAANSGLTEGDICTLRWDDIDWANGFLRRSRRKTGTHIDCPLMPELEEFIQRQPRRGEYIFPEHAAMYLRQQSCVSERVKAFLHGLGIVTTAEIPGHRAVSVKDLHSMRHVFCYRAKRYGIPEGVIKKIVGHKVLAMTQHYADHDTLDELRQEIKKLPALFAEGVRGIEDEDAICRRRLAELAFSAPLERVQSALRVFEQDNKKIEYRLTAD
jgi:integrase